MPPREATVAPATDVFRKFLLLMVIFLKVYFFCSRGLPGIGGVKLVMSILPRFKSAGR
ncbi:hypothetical protein Barb7_01350 [Bacteroidales bacterium Barb7]|nr:hypothetical protein Barb7_01350 [Bacteroidales bacterium Barb7]